MEKYLYKFKNKNGLCVKGFFVKPDSAIPAKKWGVMYLPGSVLGNVAVHRLGIDIADALTDMGYISYLFDHSRTGESEGTLPSDTNCNLNQHVVKGKMVEDTLEAIEHFKNECSVSDVILIGHCGGGLTALYAASESKAVKGVLLVSTPILREGEKDLSNSVGATKEYQMLYAKKVASIDAWKRLLTGKTDYALIGKFVKNKLSQLFPHKLSMTSINKRILRALEKIKKNKKVLMLMGDRDPGLEEYKMFADKYLDKVNESRVLKETSHGFVTEENFKLLLAEVDSFLKSFN
jgi:dienelactone hydrolase